MRVANEAEFILNRMRAEDVQKHAEFEVCHHTNPHCAKKLFILHFNVPFHWLIEAIN